MKSKMIQRMSYALGAFGHDTFYVTLSTYFMVFVTSQMFAGTDKATNAKMIATVTSLVVGIRLVEIIFDPLIGGVIDNTRTKYGKFKPWLVIGGIVSSVLLVAIFTNFFGLATHNTTLFIILFAKSISALILFTVALYNLYAIEADGIFKYPDDSIVFRFDLIVKSASIPPVAVNVSKSL